MFLDKAFNEAKKLAAAVIVDVKKIKAAASSEAVTVIAGQFPGGTAIDESCIMLCTEAQNAATKLLEALPSAQAAVDGIYHKLAADLTQVQHSNPKHGFGFFLQAVGVTLEDLATSI
jgi:hypothetical protein